jgi:Arc/MetJ-type ribon-helix-helix transcriptional regulator
VKTVTVRLPAELVADLESESRKRRCSKSDIVRERLTLAARSRVPASRTATIADLVGSVRGLPADLSGRKKAYLKTTGYGRKRPR